ncbi:carboxymuconolactone decarboxylase family protein [Streptomyces sp. NPDC037389]|uniref:carboxymuconolactone decarboxylase family protein n=1 Tax=Streptomyces sp. NPDC037389 TaxID=3155369 RepID=UPI0033D117A8
MDRAAGGGRSGTGVPAGTGAVGGLGSPYADGWPGVDRAVGGGRSGDGAPGEGDTPGGAGRAVDSGNPYNDTVRITDRAAGGSRPGDGGAPYADTVRIGAGGSGGPARDAARAVGSGDPQRPAAPDVDPAAGVGRSDDRAPGEGDTPAGARPTPDSGSPHADTAPSAGRAAGSGAWDAARRGDGHGDGDLAGGDPHARGLRLRREVLGAGDALARHLDPGDFSADYEDLVTRVVWGDIWSRAGLDRRTRFLVTLTALTAGGHLDELATHTRAALRGGVSPDEIKETLLHASLYCGLPAVGKAFEVARRVVAEEADA